MQSEETITVSNCSYFDCQNVCVSVRNKHGIALNSRDKVVGFFLFLNPSWAGPDRTGPDRIKIFVNMYITIFFVKMRMIIDLGEKVDRYNESRMGMWKFQRMKE